MPTWSAVLMQRPNCSAKADRGRRRFASWTAEQQVVDRVQAETLPAVDRGAAARSRRPRHAPRSPADCCACVGGTRCERIVIGMLRTGESIPRTGRRRVGEGSMACLGRLYQSYRTSQKNSVKTGKVYVHSVSKAVLPGSGSRRFKGRNPILTKKLMLDMINRVGALFQGGARTFLLAAYFEDGRADCTMTPVTGSRRFLCQSIAGLLPIDGRCNRQAGKRARATGAMLPVPPNRGPCHETVTRIDDHLPAP